MDGLGSKYAYFTRSTSAWRHLAQAVTRRRQASPGERQVGPANHRQSDNYRRPDTQTPHLTSRQSEPTDAPRLVR
jgi:hypothetical protein